LESLARKGRVRTERTQSALMLCDLHLHTHCSDGEFSPATVVDMLADAGVSLIAITDHDTTAGHEEASRRASERNVRFVPGIEMTTYGVGTVVHVLGLGVNSANADLGFANQAANRAFGENQRRWVESIQSRGVDIEWERDFPDNPVRLPVLIERLCRAGHVGGNPRLCHAEFREFFSALPTEAYSALPTPAQAASIIHAAGGIAILAHPADLAADGQAVGLLESLDGLEALYLRYEPDLRNTLRDLALRYGKLYTCGSDWHGYFQGPYRNPNFEAPNELLARLT
jgi:3',5'-nucleoside bisphosphate phosphatase